VNGRPREAVRHLRAFVLAWLARLSDRRVGLVLVYHGVAGETGEARTEIVPAIGAGALERHVRHLRRRYRLVPPSGIPEAVATRRRGQRIPVALTFDDDLASHAVGAAPILRRHSAPAGFFVCGASLEAPHRFWWEDLQEAIDGRLVAAADLPGLPPDLVEAALARSDRAAARLAAAVEELTPTARDCVTASLRARAGPPPAEAGLRATALRALADAGFELGFHTLRHDRLPPLEDGPLAAAFVDARDRLEEVAGRALTAISYPHGRADGRVAAVARAAGFRLGFTGGERVVTATDDPLLVPRIQPTFASQGSFAVQMARFASGRLRR
jgi:peptidoglycan/xylan/chitin deacetylase (PgdA/CDA1 family)